MQHLLKVTLLSFRPFAVAGYLFLNCTACQRTLSSYFHLCFLGIKYWGHHHWPWNLDLLVLFILAFKFTKENFELLWQITVSLLETFTILYCCLDLLKPSNCLTRACLGRWDFFHYFAWNIKLPFFLHLALSCFDIMTVANIFSVLGVRMNTPHPCKNLLTCRRYCYNPFFFFLNKWENWVHKEVICSKPHS